MMDYEKTIHGIYDAAFNIHKYGDVAADINKWIGSDAAGYILHTTDTQQVNHAGMVHYDHLPIDEVLAEYAAHWHLLNPQVQFEQSHPNSPIYYEGIDSRIDCSLKSDFGQWRYARMGGARSQMTSYCRPAANLNFAFAFSSNKHDAPESRAQIKLFQDLTAHLQRSVRLAYILGTLDNQIFPWRDNTTRQGAAIAALSTNGKMVVCNYAMERLASQCDALRLSSETFQLADPLAHRKFSEMLSATPPSSHAANNAAIFLRDKSGAPIGLLEVHPFTEAARNKTESNASFLVTIQLPSESTQLLRKRLELLLGLTVAEARVATILMRGLPSARIAKMIGVEVSTVRTQIKSIILKTGVNSKAELAHWLTLLR